MPTLSRTVNCQLSSFDFAQDNPEFIEGSTVNCRVKRGFTLIELLIVITILGILAGLTLASYGGTQERARDSKRKTDLDAIKKALELARQDSVGAYYYPSCNSYDGNNSCALSGTTTTPQLTSTTTTPYMNSVPADPKTGTGYTYIPSPASCAASACTSYSLITCLENTRDTQKDTTDTCTDANLVSYTITPN